jgi:hypothetical protein
MPRGHHCRLPTLKPRNRQITMDIRIIEYRDIMNSHIGCGEPGYGPQITWEDIVVTSYRNKGCHQNRHMRVEWRSILLYMLYISLVIIFNIIWESMSQNTVML